MSSFRRAIYGLTPAWLHTDDGERVLYSLTVLIDSFLRRAYLGLRAKLPSYGPTEALTAIGRDRKIVRGIDEPRGTYVARLHPWLDHHRVRGNAWKLCEMIRAYCGGTGVRVRTVDRRGNWFSIDRDGTRTYALDTGTWDWDTVAASPDWARFWVIVYPPTDDSLWDTDGLWGDPGQWGDGGTWGSTMSTGQAAALRSIVREWKPAGTWCEWIIIAFDDASFDPATPEPDGTWLHWADDTDSPPTPARLDSARYFRGTVTS